MVSSAGLLLITYLTIATNFVGDMFPCEVREALTNNVYAKHLVIFIVTFFFVTNGTDDPLSNKSFRHYVWRTCYVYLLFVLSCNCDTRFLLPALALMLIGEVIRSYTRRTPESKDTYALERTRVLAQSVAVGTLIIGSGVYFSTKSLHEISTIRCRGE